MCIKVRNWDNKKIKILIINNNTLKEHPHVMGGKSFTQVTS